MESYNFLILPILAAVIIGIVAGIRGRRGAAWTVLNAVVAFFVACLVISAIFLIFLMGPMASPAFSNWLSANVWVNPAATTGLVLLPPLAAWLVAKLLSRIDAR
jgi:hypothetical protein